MDLKTKIQSLQQTLNVAYTKPSIEKLEELIQELRGSPGYTYLTEQRHLTDETIEYFKLGYDSKKNAIAIPHFKNNELVNIKYRFLKPKDIRYVGEAGAESWLFHEQGLEIAREKGAVFISEGEIDAMSLWQMGVKNVISSGSGASSYSPWIELLDTIAQVWIAYDNDGPGQTAAKNLAEKIGTEKCRNIIYPDGTKDANDFLTGHDENDLRELFSKSQPFYKYEFNNIHDIVTDMVSNPREYMTTKFLPDVRIYKDNLSVLTGVTNSGKSSLALNIALDLGRREIPVLFLPLERGFFTVGRRLVQVAMNKTEEQIEFSSKKEIIALTSELVQLPIYFAMPDKKKLFETITRAQRFFGVKYVIIDQIDQAVRNVGFNKEIAISDTIRDIKMLTESMPIAVLLVSHIRKLQTGEKISMDALKGSNSLSTDPETVILLDREHEEESDEWSEWIEVRIAKNKGKMSRKKFKINDLTGTITDDYDPNDW